MSDFIKRESQLEQIPSVLISSVLGFSKSHDYLQLRHYELDIPGVVLSAVASYLVRVHECAFAKPNDESIQAQIESVYATIEMLASYTESAVENLIIDEFFESLASRPDLLNGIETQFRPQTLALYERSKK